MEEQQKALTFLDMPKDIPIATKSLTIRTSVAGCGCGSDRFAPISPAISITPHLYSLSPLLSAFVSALQSPYMSPRDLEPPAHSCSCARKPRPPPSVPPPPRRRRRCHAPTVPTRRISTRPARPSRRRQSATTPVASTRPRFPTAVAAPAAAAPRSTCNKAATSSCTQPRVRPSLSLWIEPPTLGAESRWWREQASVGG